MRHKLKYSIAAVGFVLASASLTPSAQAVPLLSFGQASNANTVVGTRTGSSTSLNATNATVSVTQIDAALSTPMPAFLTFDFDNTGAATLMGGSVTQNFSGSFCITAGANCTGTNYLSGTLIDVAFGVNAAFNLVASTPPAGDVTFTSSVISASDLGVDRGAGFSFANVSPLLHITNGTIDSFSSSVSGTFSGSVNSVPAPEPVSLSLLGVGLIGLGAIRRFSASKAD